MKHKDIMVIIQPSILSAHLARLGEVAEEAEVVGAIAIQIDVMVGHFFPNINFGPGVVAALRPSVKLTLDLHLMIFELERYSGVFAEGRRRPYNCPSRSLCKGPPGA